MKKIGNFFINNGVDNMIITDGSKGSYLFVDKKYYEIPAYKPNKIVDPTGAGDTYLSAFIRALELYKDSEKRGKFAAMVASMSLENRGAFQYTIKDVRNRLGFK